MKLKIYLFKTVLLIAALCIGLESVKAAAPIITSFTPASGAVGTTVTITGTGFSTTPGLNIVYFGATQATVTGATAGTSLTVTVPAGATYNYITELTSNLSCQSPTKFLPTYTPAESPFNSGLFDAASILAMPPGPPLGILSIAVGDINGDGLPDLVVSYNGVAEIGVYRNNSTSGTISFFSPILFTTPNVNGAKTIALADIDGDGKLDIVLVNPSAAATSGLSVFRNTSSGSFITMGTIQNFTTGTFPEGVVIGDIDGDGKPDIVVSNHTSNTMSLFKNTSSSGSISLSAKVDIATVGSGLPMYMAMGDVNNDGKPDIIVGYTGSSQVSVYQNNATTGSAFSSSLGTTLKTPVNLSTTNVTSAGLTLADIDGDGKLDVVGIAPAGNGPLYVDRNANSGTTVAFAGMVTFGTSSGSSGAWGVDVGDIDGDGKPDVVSVVSSNIQAYHNTATSGTIQNTSPKSLQLPVNFAVPQSSTQPSLIIADLDGDGRPDMVTGSITVSAGGYIFRNDPHTLLFSSLSGDSISDVPFCSGETINIPFTSTGTFSGTNVYSVQIANNPGIHGNFSAPTTIGTLSSSANSGNISVTIPTDFVSGTYNLRIVSSSPVSISDTATISFNSAFGLSDAEVCTNGTDTGTAIFTVSDPGAGNTVYWSTDGINDNDGTQPGGLGDTSNIYQNNKTVSQGNPVTEYVQIAYAACTTPFASATGFAAPIPAAATGLNYPTVCGDSGDVTFTINDPGLGFFVAASYAYFGGSGIWSEIVVGGGAGPFSFTTESDGPDMPPPVYAGGPYLFIAQLIDESSGCFALDTSFATAYDTLPAPSGLSNQTVCGDGNVTFTVSDPGPGLSIDWAIDTTNIDAIGAGGSGPVTITQSLTVGSPITEFARIDIGCLTGPWVGATGTANTCSAISTWLGTFSNLWSDPNNWSPVGQPNSCGASVIIDQGAPMAPVVDTTVQVGNITLTGTGRETIEVDSNLSVCGNILSSSGLITDLTGLGLVTLTGTADTLDGNISFQTLVLNNGDGENAQLTATASVSISTALVLQSGNIDNSLGGTLTLESASVTQVAIIDNFSAAALPGTGTITGNVTAQRFYGAASASNDFKQHMLGSPVSGINLSALGSNSGSSAYYIAATGGIHNCNELLGESGTPYGNVFSYDETHASTCTMDGWLVGAASTAVSAGTGYSVVLGNGSGTVSLTGPANLSSSYGVSTTNSGYANTTSDQGRVYPSGINLVSNPYSAVLDVSSLNTANSTDFSSQTVYVWNVATGSYDMNPATIAPFQAFKVIQSAAGSSSYTIPGSSRTTSTGTFQRTANPIELNMAITNNGTGLTDNTIVGFNANSAAQFDATYDVIKLPGALTRHTLYSLSSNYWLAVNTLNSINETSTVLVGFEPGVSGTYTANFSGSTSFDPTSYIMLEDLQTGTMFNVRDGEYTFTSNANDNFNRFVLHFTPPASISTTGGTCYEQGMINIVQPGTAIWNYTLADNNNVILSSGTLNVNSPVSVSIPVGVYIFTLKDNNGYTVVKTIEVSGVQPVAASLTSSASSVNVNQDVTFNGTSNGTALNTWNFGDGTTDNGTTVSHAYTNEGIYNVTLNSTSASGCNSSASSTITVTRSVTGVTDLNDISNILIWSNEDMVNVDFTKLKDVQANIEIYNILGQKLCEDKYAASTVYHKQIPGIEEGYIVVNVKNNDAVITKKLFISNVR